LSTLPAAFFGPDPGPAVRNGDGGRCALSGYGAGRLRRGGAVGAPRQPVCAPQEEGGPGRTAPVRAVMTAGRTGPPQAYMGSAAPCAPGIP